MSEWISVEERMPEIDVDVQTFRFGFSGIERLERQIVARWDGEVWVDWALQEVSPECVTHWMPLPDPPKDKP